MYDDLSKYNINNNFVGKEFNLCGNNAFLFSPDFIKFENDITSSFTGYLVIESTNKYMIKVRMSKIDSPFSLHSILYDEYLFVFWSRNDSYDIIIEGESPKVSYRFVTLAFQNDGTYLILAKEESFKLLKEYNVKSLYD